MKMTGSGKYTIMLSLALLAIGMPFMAFSQTDTLTQSGKDPATEIKSLTSNHSLYAGAGAGNNMIYLGSTISQNQPFCSASVTYGFRNSLFLSVSGNHIKELNPYLAFYSLSLSYSHTFNSWFDISSGIAGYMTPETLEESLFSDFALINLTTGFDWKLIYTKLSFGGLVSATNSGYLQIKNSRYFEIMKFIKDKGMIFIDPGINILFGKLVEIETSPGVKKFGVSPPFRHIKKNPNSTTEIYSSKFGLIDFEFSLPVTFSYGNFSIEADPTYIIPAYSNPDYPSTKGFSFILSAYLKIF